MLKKAAGEECGHAQSPAMHNQRLVAAGGESLHARLPASHRRCCVRAEGEGALALERTWAWAAAEACAEGYS